MTRGDPPPVPRDASSPFPFVIVILAVLATLLSVHAGSIIGLTVSHAILLAAAIWCFRRDLRSFRGQRAILSRRCPRCRYDLREQFSGKGDRCPECGESIARLREGGWL